jgi:hypothetical protein
MNITEKSRYSGKVANAHIFVDHYIFKRNIFQLLADKAS